MNTYSLQSCLAIVVIAIITTLIFGSVTLPIFGQAPNNLMPGANNNNNMRPVIMQISGQGVGKAFCPQSANAQQPVPQRELDGVQIRFDLGQPASSPDGKAFGELSIFRSDLSLAKYGQINRSYENTDNSLVVGGLVYQDALCDSTAHNPPSSSAMPVPTFKITGQCGTAIPIEFTASNGERALFNGNIQCLK